MARMHGGSKGKSGSKRPTVKTKPSWVRYKPIEVEMLMVKLAKEGKTASQIGTVLRDTYGIPDIRSLLGKKTSQVLVDKKLAPEIPEDLMNLIKRAIAIRKHMETNRQDQTAKRGLQLTESKIKRIVKYYKQTGKLTEEWKYDPEKIKLMIS